MDDFHDSEEVRFWRVENLIGESAALGLASRLLDDLELLLVSAKEPSMFAQAERGTQTRGGR